LRFRVYRSVTPLVEPLSLDEAYLDVTENSWGEPLATPVARRLKTRILEETGLTASAGVAPNKFLAKIASGWKKPDGLTVIAPERVEDFLQKLPVDALWGVGPKTAARLRAAGIERLVDVRAQDEAALTALVGSMAGWLRHLANGIDERRVEPHRVSKSSGSERTYTEDLTDLGTESAPGYALFGLSAGYVFDQGPWRVNTFARVDNLADRHVIGSVIVNDGNGRYYEPAPGRSFLVGVDLTWR